MAAFVLKLSEIQQRSPCTLDVFKTAKRARDANGDIVFPQGFTPEVLHDLAIRVPVDLLWLTGNGLIPVTRAAVFEAIEKAHGADGLRNIRSEAAERAKARQANKPEAPAPTMARKASGTPRFPGSGATTAATASAAATSEVKTLPTKDEYVKAGYAADNYDAFVKSHLEAGGWKLPEAAPSTTTTTSKPKTEKTKDK